MNEPEKHQPLAVAIPEPVSAAAVEADLGDCLDRIYLPADPSAGALFMFAAVFALPGSLVIHPPGPGAAVVGVGFLALSGATAVTARQVAKRHGFPCLYCYDRGVVVRVEARRDRPERVTVFGWNDLVGFTEVRGAYVGQAQNWRVHRWLELRTRAGEVVAVVPELDNPHLAQHLVRHR